MQQYQGSGTSMARAATQLLLTAAKSQDGTDRVGVRIWHRDPQSGATVADYDNMRNGFGADAAGSIVDEGSMSAGAE